MSKQQSLNNSEKVQAKTTNLITEGNTDSINRKSPFLFLHNPNTLNKVIHENHLIDKDVSRRLILNSRVIQVENVEETQSHRNGHRKRRKRRTIRNPNRKTTKVSVSETFEDIQNSNREALEILDKRI